MSEPQPYSRVELQRWLADLEADLEEMQGTRVWLLTEIERLLPRAAPDESAPGTLASPAAEPPAPGSERARVVPRQADGRRGYTFVNPAKVRTYIQQAGEATPAEIADALGISVGSVYNHTKALYEAGTLVKVRRGGRAYWRIAKPGERRPALKTKPARGAGPRVGSGVAGTGKQNLARQKRRGAIKGVGGH